MPEHGYVFKTQHFCVEICALAQDTRDGNSSDLDPYWHIAINLAHLELKWLGCITAITSELH